MEFIYVYSFFKFCLPCSTLKKKNTHHLTP